MSRTTPPRFNNATIEYVNLYVRPALPAITGYALDPWCSFGVPAGWEAVELGELRFLERESGRHFAAGLAHVGGHSQITSHIAFEPCWDDAGDEFRPGLPLLDIAHDRASSTPGGGRMVAPPVEFGVAGSFACYLPIGVANAPFGARDTIPALHATVIVKAPRRGYPLTLFTPWNDANETIPALRTVLDTWQWR